MNLMTQCHILPDSKNNPSLCVLFDPCLPGLSCYGQIDHFKQKGGGWLGFCSTTFCVKQDLNPLILRELILIGQVKSVFPLLR